MRKQVPPKFPELKVALSDGGAVLKEWTQPCQADLAEILETVKRVKQSVNDYLTELIGTGDSSLNDDVEVSDMSDMEEEVRDDSVSGFIKGRAVDEKSKVCEKRKISCSSQAKRMKK